MKGTGDPHTSLFPDLSLVQPSPDLASDRII